MEEGFLPTVAPASCFPTLIDEHYGSSEAALKAVAKAMGEEYKAVVDSGLNVQVDDAFIPFMYDIMVPPGTKEDWLAWGQAQIDSVNLALEGLPKEKVRYHVCWGSWNGPHTNDVPLRDVLSLILQVNAGTILFENANPRHEHEWRVWEDIDLPDGLVLAPGVISHATNVVEHPELVAERLERIARIVGPERVVGSTDCGFAQGPYLRRVHPTIQWAKLEALAEGAKIASRTWEPSPHEHRLDPAGTAWHHRRRARRRAGGADGRAGSGQGHHGAAELREFRDPFQHGASDDYAASAVVMPTTVEEIQAIVRDRQRARASRCGPTARAATTATAAPPRA